MPVVSDGEQKRLEGIITDRDLCCRMVAQKGFGNKNMRANGDAYSVQNLH